MGLKLEEIKSLIKEALPDAEISIQDLAGDDNHYSATIKSKIFSGVPFIKRQISFFSNSSFIFFFKFSSIIYLSRVFKASA